MSPGSRPTGCGQASPAAALTCAGLAVARDGTLAASPIRAHLLAQAVRPGLDGLALAQSVIDNALAVMTAAAVRFLAIRSRARPERIDRQRRGDCWPGNCRSTLACPPVWTEVWRVLVAR